MVLLAALAQGCIIHDDDDHHHLPPAGEAQFDLYWQFASGRLCAPNEEVWVFFDPDYFGEPDRFNCENGERQGDMSGLTGDLPLDVYDLTVGVYVNDVATLPFIGFRDSLTVDGQIKQHTVVFDD